MAAANTGRVARGLGEFAIIVIGVLVALAAENWLQDREDGERARAAIVLLLEDLRADSTSLSQALAPGARRDTLAAQLFSDPDLSGDSALMLLRALFNSANYLPTRSTFESLLQSDGVRHIGDTELQVALVRYYQETQANVSVWNQWYLDQYFLFIERLSRHISPSPASLEEALQVRTAQPLELRTPWPEVRDDNELMTQIWYARNFEQALDLRLLEALETNADLSRLLAEQR
jgi:hypothetical protein